MLPCWFLVNLLKEGVESGWAKAYLSVFHWKEDTEKKESLGRGGWKMKKTENEIKVKQAHVINLRFSDY